jgi:hypothetical protein
MAIDSVSSAILSATFPATMSATPATARPSVTQSVLAEEASVVATLSGGSGSSNFQTYDATGLLTQVQQASEAAAGASATTANNIATPGSAIAGDWATILKSNPSMAGIAVADAVAQGIVNTINVVA